MKLRPPEWIRNAVIYQIFPDSFSNGKTENDPPDTIDWGSRPERNRFYGGDLEGVIRKLDYIKELGANCIYLTPVFDAPSNHKYDTRNYFKVDDSFGGNQTLIELVRESHSREIRVILDGVFNHCGIEHPFFVDAVDKGRSSTYWDWFSIDSTPVTELPEPNYRCFAGYGRMPEFNLTNPQVRHYLLKVVRYWFEKANIDGWRLDTVEYLHPDFVREIRVASKEMKADSYVFGELLHLGTSWFKGEYLDGAMNYRLRKYILSFFVFSNIGAETFDEKLYVLRRSYPEWANYSMYNMINSHDRPRITTLCNGRKDLVKLIFLFMFTYPGIPALYYGDEIFMEGGPDPDCRRSMIWEDEYWDVEFRDFCKGLIKLRKENEALKNGMFESLIAKAGVFAFQRRSEEERILVFLNSSKEIRRFPIEESFETLLSHNTSIGQDFVELSFYGFAVLKILS